MATQLIGWVGLNTALFLFALNSVWLFPFMVWVVLGVVYFGLSFLANSTFEHFDLAAHDRLVADWRGSRQPSVDVFLPSCGEDLEVLENTFRHVAALEHSGPVTVYCLDDAGRRELEALAGRYRFRYLSRPNRGSSRRRAT